MGQAIEGRKGLKRNGKRKEKKNQKGPNRRIQKLKKQIKDMKQILVWTSNKINSRKTKRESAKKEKEILQKLKKWADQQQNRKSSIKEKALDKLRYLNIKMNGIKIKGVRIRNNNMFQGNVSTNQLKRRVPKMKIFEEFWVGIWYNNTNTP